MSSARRKNSGEKADRDAEQATASADLPSGDKSASNADEAPPRIRKKLSLKKKLFFGLIVSVIPAVLLVVVLELLLRIVGYGYPTSFVLEREIDGKKMLTDNVRFGWRFFPPTIARRPHDFVIPASKPAETCRIFVFGESAAWGDPDPSYGIARQLRVLLEQRFPAKKFEVINAAMAAINSHVVLEIARDAARHDPDFFITYMGNNEVIGPYGPGTVFSKFSADLSMIRASIQAKEFLLSQLLTNMRLQLQGRARQPHTWAGMQMFLNNQLPASDPRLKDTYSHFAANLRDMCAAGTEAGATNLVCTMAANYRDCAPFASLHSAGLDEAGQKQFKQLVARGEAAGKNGQYADAAENYRKAIAMDPHYAEAQYRLAATYDELKDYKQASEHYRQALDEDTLRFRSDSKLNGLIRETAKQQNAQLVDIQALFEKESENGIPGASLLVDHVHMTFHGNYLIALELAKQIAVTLDKGATGDGTYVPETEVAARLAHTEYNRLRVAEKNYARLRNPPFTNQLNHSEQKVMLESELEQLRAFSKPEQLQKIIPQYEAAITSAPTDWVLHENFADVFQRLGDAARETEQLKLVLQMLPHHQERHTWLGQSLANQVKLDAAIESYKKAIAFDPWNEAANKGLGSVLLRQRKIPEGLKSYQAAIDANPKSGENQHDLGLAYLQLNRIEDAVKCFELAVKLKPELAAVTTQIGVDLTERKKLPAAISCLEAAVSAQPDFGPGHQHLGNAYFQSGKFPEAIREYEIAVKLLPEVAPIRNNLASAYAHSGKTAEAITELQEAVKLDPKTVPLHRNLALLLLEAGRKPEAIKEFEIVVELDPADAEAKEYISKLKAETP